MKKCQRQVFFLSLCFFLFFCVQPVNGKENLTTRKEKAACQIYECLSTFDTYVDISEYQIPYSSATATSLFDLALEKDLYLFNILANVSDFSKVDDFCSCYTEGNYLVAFEFDYGNYSADTLQNQYDTLKKKVLSISNELQLSQISDEWAVASVHNYIALHTDYDQAKHPKRKSYTAYGALVNGKAVCSGYSTACELLLKTAGVPCRIITSNKMDHAWNIVKLKGKWYHMDITWDDPYVNKKNYVSYRFFLKTDKELKSDKKSPHYGWSSSVKCTSNRYKNIPATDNSRLVYCNEGWYYAKKNKSGIYYYQKYNFSFTKRKKTSVNWNLVSLTVKKNIRTN